MQESVVRGQGSELRFDNGENIHNFIRKGVLKVRKAEEGGKNIVILGIRGPRGGFLCPDVLLNPQDAAALGEQLLRVAKDLGARVVWPD